MGLVAVDEVAGVVLEAFDMDLGLSLHRLVCFRCHLMI